MSTSFSYLAAYQSVTEAVYHYILEHDVVSVADIRAGIPEAKYNSIRSALIRLEKQLRAVRIERGYYTVPTEHETIYRHVYGVLAYCHNKKQFFTAYLFTVRPEREDIEAELEAKVRGAAKRCKIQEDMGYGVDEISERELEGKKLEVIYFEQR